MTNRVLPRKHIREINKYKPIRPLEILVKEFKIPLNGIIKLDGNENPFSSDYLFKNNLQILENVQIYPDPDSSSLTDFLSSKENLGPNNIFVSAGIDELLDLLIRTFVEKHELVLTLSPTFGMYSFLSQVNGVMFEYFNRKMVIQKEIAQFEFDESEFLKKAKKAKLIFLTRPNNPDGICYNDKFISKLLQLPLLVVIDEAYIEFALHESLAKWIDRFDNLVILRTFSKAFGLGGLRIGYGLMPSYIKSILMEIKQPYNVNVIAQKIIPFVLNHTQVQSNIEEIKKSKVLFVKELITKQPQFSNYWIFLSEASFVLLHFHSVELAKTVYTSLYSRGILTRYYSTPDMEKNLRISIGRFDQMKVVLANFFEIMEGL